MTSLMTGLILLMLLVLLAWCCSSIAWRKWRRRGRHLSETTEDELESLRLPLPPGSMGLPVIGEMFSFILQASSGAFFANRVRRYGPVFKTHILGRPTIFVSGSSAVRKILLGEHVLVETAWPPAMKSLLGPGALSSSTGDIHRNLRKTTASCLDREQVCLHAETMKQIIAQEIDSWLTVGTQPVDIYLAAKRMTTRIAARVILGIDLQRSEEKTIQELVAMHRGVGNETSLAAGATEHDRLASEVATDLDLFGGGFFSLPLPIPGTAFKKALSAKSRLRRLLIAKLNSYESRSDHDDGVVRSVLAELNRKRATRSLTPRSDDEAANMTSSVDQALELLFGGQETLSGLVTCILILLASCNGSSSASAYEKVAAEVLNTADCGHVDDDDASGSNFRYQYVDAVINEVLRMWPPIGGGYRIARRTFSVDGYKVPRGWAVTYGIKDTHNLCSLFSIDPEMFNPDRWSEISKARDSAGSTSSSNTLNFQFLPFGAGARACIGRRYALLFARTFCVELAHRCSRWNLMTSLTPVPMVTVPVVKPRDPVFAMFEPRERSSCW